MRALFVTLLLTLNTMAFAETIVDETFTATFSDYGQLESLLKCSPGHRGFFATEDVLTLQARSIDLGVHVSGDFIAYSNLGLSSDPVNKNPTRRPYDAGCKPALDQLKAATQDKEVVELKVRREVTLRPTPQNRVLRNLQGDVLSIQYLVVEQFYEAIYFELGGFEFRAGHALNGRNLN